MLAENLGRAGSR